MAAKCSVTAVQLTYNLKRACLAFTIEWVRREEIILLYGIHDYSSFLCCHHGHADVGVCIDDVNFGLVSVSVTSISDAFPLSLIPRLASYRAHIHLSLIHYIHCKPMHEMNQHNCQLKFNAYLVIILFHF